MLPVQANGKHLCRQQCVRNNVSSFARALRHIRGGGLGEPNNAMTEKATFYLTLIDDTVPFQ